MLSVRHRCGDAPISADERSDAGARMLQDQNFAALVLCENSRAHRGSDALSTLQQGAATLVAREGRHPLPLNKSESLSGRIEIVLAFAVSRNLTFPRSWRARQSKTRAEQEQATVLNSTAVGRHHARTCAGVPTSRSLPASSRRAGCHGSTAAGWPPLRFRRQLGIHQDCAAVRIFQLPFSLGWLDCLPMNNLPFLRILPAVGLLAVLTFPTFAHSPAEDMAGAAKNLLAALSPEQRAKATFEFKSDERVNWHFIPRARKGLPWKEMAQEQRHLGHALLASAVSQRGYIKATTIMVWSKFQRAGTRQRPEP